MANGINISIFLLRKWECLKSIRDAKWYCLMAQAYDLWANWYRALVAKSAQCHSLWGALSGFCDGLLAWAAVAATLPTRTIDRCDAATLHTPYRKIEEEEVCGCRPGYNPSRLSATSVRPVRF